VSVPRSVMPRTRLSFRQKEETMKSIFKCVDCEKAQISSHGIGRKHERCTGCQIYSAEARKAAIRKSQSEKEFADYDAKERVLAGQLRKARASNEEAYDPADIGVLQQKVTKLQKQKRHASKSIDASVLGFTRQQFLLWRKKPNHQRCHFCHVTDDALRSLASAEEHGSRMLPFVGIDRIDYSKTHMLKNIVPCCERCDAMRSKPAGLSFAELRRLGPMLKKLWRSRLRGE